MALWPIHWQTVGRPMMADHHWSHAGPLGADLGPNRWPCGTSCGRLGGDVELLGADLGVLVPGILESLGPGISEGSGLEKVPCLPVGLDPFLK